MEVTSVIDLQVMDATGRVVHQTNSESGLQHNFNLDLSEQGNGVYFVRLQIGGEVLTRKIILAK